MRKIRGSHMERRASILIFFFVVCVSLGFSQVSLAAAPQLTRTEPKPASAEPSSPEKTAQEGPAPQSQTSEQTKTEQYTLSQERYEKAVAYSRAAYTLYFASYFLVGL